MPLQLRRTFWGLLVFAVLVCLTWAGTGAAATPPAGSVGTASPRFDWAGQVYVIGTVADIRQCQAAPTDPANATCDHFQLTAQNTGTVTVTITWADENDDFDLLVCVPGDDPGEDPTDPFYPFVGDDCTGTLTQDYVVVAASQGFPPGTSETVSFMATAGTTYEVRAVPFSVAGALTTCPEVEGAVPGTPAVGGYCGTATFAAPPGDGGTGGGGGGGIDPPVWIGDATVVEGDAGLPEAVFTLTMGWESPVPATVNFTTGDLTAVAGEDYVPSTGQATFAPGETRTTIRIPVRSDFGDEPDERFTVDLHVGTASVVKIMDARGVGRILDDDWRRYIDANVRTSNDGRLTAWARQGKWGRVYYTDSAVRFYGLWITSTSFDDLTRTARIEGSGYKNGRRMSFLLEAKDSALGPDSFTLTLGDGTTISPLLIQSGDIRYGG